MLAWPARWGSGLLAGLLVWAVAGPVFADEAALNWVRLDGADACIDAPHLAKLVETRIGRPVLQSPARADLSIEGHVGPLPTGGYHAVIAVHARDGALIGERELKVAPGDCTQLDQPASLVISLMIDPDAAGPGLMEHGALSPVAQRLVAQLDLPSGDPGTLLASLDVAPELREYPPSSSSVLPEPTPAHEEKAKVVPPAPEQSHFANRKIMSVSQEEWHQVQALRHERLLARAPDAPTPRLPGYLLLGLAGVAATSAAYAQLRLTLLNNDPKFVAYLHELGQSSGEACDAVLGEQPASYYSYPKALDTCREASVLSALIWVSAVITVASAAAGTAWLLWIADDKEREPKATVSLRPYMLGAELRLQL